MDKGESKIDSPHHRKGINYMNRRTWRRPEVSIPMGINPRIVFKTSSVAVQIWSAYIKLDCLLITYSAMRAIQNNK